MKNDDFYFKDRTSLGCLRFRLGKPISLRSMCSLRLKFCFVYLLYFPAQNPCPSVPSVVKMFFFVLWLRRAVFSAAFATLA